jgi:hypothetical protein
MGKFGASFGLKKTASSAPSPNISCLDNIEDQMARLRQREVF